MWNYYSIMFRASKIFQRMIFIKKLMVVVLKKIFLIFDRQI